MSAEVAVVGSYNVGLTVQTPRLPVIGETILGERFLEGPGGKGSNQAIAAARLGGEVHFVACIGPDRYGDDALALWEREGIHAHVRRDTTHTGIGLIFLYPDGDNAIIVTPGANSLLSPGDVDLREEAIASCQVLLLQLEIRVETAIHAAKLAKHHGLTVILNPAPVQPLPPEVFQFVDVLTPNETEAHVLIGEAPDSKSPLEGVTEQLLGLGVQAVVLTEGQAGMLIATAEGVESVRSPLVKTVDATGAGDAFNGVLAVGLAEGKSLVEAARRACYAGANCATRMEVIPGLVRRAQLSRFIQQHPL